MKCFCPPQEFLEGNGCPTDDALAVHSQWVEFFGRRCFLTRKKRKTNSVHGSGGTKKAILKLQSASRASILKARNRKGRGNLKSVVHPQNALIHYRPNMDDVDKALEGNEVLMKYIRWYEGSKSLQRERHVDQMRGVRNPYAKDVAEARRQSAAQVAIQRQHGKDKDMTKRKDVNVFMSGGFLRAVPDAVEKLPSHISYVSARHVADCHVVLVHSLVELHREIGTPCAVIGKVESFSLPYPIACAVVFGLRVATLEWLEDRSLPSVKFRAAITKQWGYLIDDDFKKSYKSMWEMVNYAVSMAGSKWVILDAAAYHHWSSDRKLKSKCSSISQVWQLHKVWTVLRIVDRLNSGSSVN